MAGPEAAMPHRRTAELCTKSGTVMIFLCGPLRISAISALKKLFQRRDRRDTQRTAEKDFKTGKATSPFGAKPC